MIRSSATAVRLFALTGAVLLVVGGAYQLRGTLRPTYARLPEWSLHDLPLVLDGWQGQATELDEELFRAIDADVVSNRLYRNRQGDVVSVHTAAFTDYDFGVQHNPIVCYRGNGWEVADQQDLALDVGDGKTITVRLVTWTQKRRKVMTLFWYQLGEEMVFDRGDLGWARIKLWREPVWPPLVKVLMEAPAFAPGDAQRDLSDLAGQIYRWINGPRAEPAAASGGSAGQPEVGPAIAPGEAEQETSTNPA
jgi:EpsI family protein